MRASAARCGARSNWGPSLLARGHAEAARRLERAGLTPALVQRPLAAAAERLARAGLTPKLVERPIGLASERLARTRLTPALVERPLAQAQARLGALARLAGQLHPKKPLERGFALILDAENRPVTSRAAAAGQARLTAEFADGRLDLAPVGAAPVPRAPAPRPSKPANPGQDDLFG